MSQQKRVRRRVDGKLVEQGVPAARASRRSKRVNSDGANAPRDGTTRREFMKGMGAAGALLGLPLAAPDTRAQGGDGRAVDHGRGRRHRHGRRTSLTLFFNLSHLRGALTTHYLYLGGRKYQLDRVADHPHVLAHARRSNLFLQAIDDSQITHHAVGVDSAEDVVTLAYLACNENPQTGTWEMTGMHFNIPQSAFVFAHRQARLLNPRGPLPLSGKRRRYGLPPAQSVQDMVDEAALVDVSSFAETIVGLHPEILSVEPTSAAHIQTNYVSQDSNTQYLAGLLQTMGPAVPAGAANVSGAPPWATLQPLIDKDTKTPYTKADGRLYQYHPVWNPLVVQNVAPAVNSLQPVVKDDTVLGIDVTGYNLNNPSVRPPPGRLTGALWARHDGIATVEQPIAVAASAQGGPTVTFTNVNVETGLNVTAPSISTAPDGQRVMITLDNVSNWFLRWLGVWVQFFDANGKLILLKDLPHDTFPAEPGPYPRKQDKTDAMFLGVVPPAFAVMGIPMFPGSFSPTVYLPEKSMRIMYTGLGLSGSELPTPTFIYDHGAAMTATFNYGLVALFMAVGADTYPVIFKRVVSLGGGAVASAITALAGGVTNQADFAKGLASFTMAFIKVLLTVGNSQIIAAVVEAIFEELAAAEVIDSIPLAGQISEAVAATIGVIQLAETSIEIACSPPAYVFDVVATHDLSVTFIPDKNNAQFPQPPSGYVVYYKVSYLFDNGTAHTRSAVTFDPTVTSIPVTFTGIPYGGQVNVSIGFYMRRANAPEGQNDWCAGYATTGLVPNTTATITPPDGLAGFRITEIKIPITAATRYVHTRKTALDAQGSHLWVGDPDGSHAPPYLPPPDSQQPSLGGFGSITVRQATAAQQGYVGYAWTAFSSGVNGCGTPAPGQFDQLANLNTDAGNNGANAQSGYVNSQSLCGYQRGVRIGYNLLTHNSLNMYLDTSTLMIREVNLDPPGFAGPSSGRSFAALNMDSTRCMLHPAGFIVSISDAYHKIEAVRLPAASLADADAEKYFLARTYAGLGSRPGLIDTPVAAAISPDGTILVLEHGNSRIQAFDIGGNPARHFKNQPSPYFLELNAANRTYLDIAVEFSGYLYVLSKDASNVHRLDIYHPTQDGTRPICTTQNLNGAKLAVDFWRNVYTLNYEVLRLPNGSIPGFTEPSVSLWVPPP